ncbi:MAG TPA: hypothetical protein VF784_07560 [Anaerolineales bacterium]
MSIAADADHHDRFHVKVTPAYILLAILAIATLYFYQDPESNGNSRLAVTRAVVEHGSLQIDSYLQQANWESVDKAFYNGHYYGDKAIGAWLLAVPFYFVIFKLFGLLSSMAIKHSLTALVMGSAFTITGVLLHQIALIVSQNAWKALLAALGVSLGTMLWPYSVVYFGHVPAAMFATLAFYLLLRWRSRAEAPSRRSLFWAGLAMGFAFITDYTTALIIAGLLVYAIYIVSGSGLKDWLSASMWGFLGAAIPLSFMVAYNVLVYGTPLAFGYSHEATPAFSQGQTTGLMGIGVPNLSVLYHISVDPRFGLFWQSPVLLLAVVGFIASLRRRAWRVEAALCLYVILSLLLMNAGYFLWWGGAVSGPRFLIVALPFFIVPLALVPDRLTWLLGILAAVSAGQMMIPLLGTILVPLSYDPTTDQFSINAPFNGFSILYQYGIPIIFKLHQKGTLPWTLGSAVRLRYRFSAALLVVVEGLLIGLLYRVTRTKKRASGSTG